MVQRQFMHYFRFKLYNGINHTEKIPCMNTFESLHFSLGDHVANKKLMETSKTLVVTNAAETEVQIV